MALPTKHSRVWFKLVYWASLCKAQTPPTILWHQKQPESALWGWTVWLCPKEGSLRQLERTVFPSFAFSNSQSIVSHQRWSAGQQIELIFDVLDDRQLRHGFLDPQSSESSSRVGVPALSHQFAHHTQSLVYEQGHRYLYKSLNMTLFRQQTEMSASYLE